MAWVKTAIDLGRAIQMLRLQQGLTQAELSERAGVSRRWVGKLEDGHSGAELGRVLRVLRVLNVSLDLVPRLASDEAKP